jgi:hypothetical protein
MTPQEIDEFLTMQRTARVATTNGDRPHVTPLWFIWDGGALWLYSIIKSRRWADLRNDPPVWHCRSTSAPPVDLRRPPGVHAPSAWAMSEAVPLCECDDRRTSGVVEARAQGAQSKATRSRPPQCL